MAQMTCLSLLKNFGFSYISKNTVSQLYRLLID